MSWLLKICASGAVTVDLSNFQQKCIEAWQNVYFSSQERTNRLKNFNIDTSEVQRLLNFSGCPNSQSILSSIQSGDQESLMTEYTNMYSWLRTANLEREKYDAIYQVSKLLRDHMDKSDTYEFNEQELQISINQTIQTTMKNMEAIKQNLEGAISRIDGWSTPMLIIIPNPSSSVYNMKDDYTEPATSALVDFGQDDMAPNFSYFLDAENSKIEVDDVLEAGDSDFFTTPQMQRDYFSLIKELKNPGSSQKQGRRKVLYTARPVSDRGVYLQNKRIPSNIFLSSSFSDAEGIGMDLSSSGGRDIWKVIIDGNYLIQTLDTPSIKHYQAVGNEDWIPVHSIELIQPA